MYMKLQKKDTFYFIEAKFLENNILAILSNWFKIFYNLEILLELQRILVKEINEI